MKWRSRNYLKYCATNDSIVIIFCFRIPLPRMQGHGLTLSDISGALCTTSLSAGIPMSTCVSSLNGLGVLPIGSI